MANTTAYVGFLRGINVGQAKRMPMADLRALVESLGYTGVKTLLNSGNLVFRGPAVLWCSEGILASRAASAMDKALRDKCTSRNWATALKIGALLEASA